MIEAELKRNQYQGFHFERWGAKYVCGTVTLYLNGKWERKFYFNSKKERQEIFRLWGFKYNLKNHGHYHIDIKYDKTVRERVRTPNNYTL